MKSKILGIIGGVALVLALLSPLVLRNRNKVERTFEAAEELYERAEYADAIEKYNKVLADSNKTGAKTEVINQDFLSHVNYKAAQCLKHLNQNDKALQHYWLIIAEFPESQYATDSHVESGDIYFDRKDYENANEVYKRALSVTADEERKKQIYQKLQQLPIPQFPVMEERDIRHFADLTEATSLRFEERFEAAATQYKAFADAHWPLEDAVYALYWAGRCYHDVHLFSQSVDAFAQIIDDYGYSPNVIEAYHGLASAYYKWAEIGGDKSKWKLVISTVEEAEQKYANSNTDLNREFLRLMEVLKRKVPTPEPPKPTPPPKPPEPTPTPEPPKPTPEEICVVQGRAHLEKDELELAIKKAKQALHINSSYKPAHQLLTEIKKIYYERGLTFLDENQYSDAIAEFNMVIRIEPRHKEAHFNLGVAYFNKHNYASAEKATNAALAIDPGYEEALRLLELIREHKVN